MAQKTLAQATSNVQAPVSSSKLIFNSVQLHIIDRKGKPWVRGYQIGTALGYGENADISIRKLYTRHADEFTDAMTAVVTLPTEGGPQETRIFSLRGCHLLAMFARTPVAKEFRRWVLDVLETWETARAHPLILPSAPQALSPFPRVPASFPDALRMLADIEEALENSRKTGSPTSPGSVCAAIENGNGNSCLAPGGADLPGAAAECGANKFL